MAHEEIQLLKEVEFSCENKHLGVKEKTGVTKRMFSIDVGEKLIAVQNKQGKQRWKLTDPKAKLTKDGKIISK